MADETRISIVSKVSMNTNTDMICHLLHCQEDLELAHPKADAAFVALSDQTIGHVQERKVYVFREIFGFDQMLKVSQTCHPKSLCQTARFYLPVLGMNCQCTPDKL